MKNQSEAEYYHAVIDSKRDDEDEILAEPIDDSKIIKNNQYETYPQFNKTLLKYLRYAYLGGRHTVGCLEEAVEAGSVAYGCYLVAVYNPEYRTQAACLFILAAGYASFISHVASLIGAIKIEGPSYHKILKESIGGSVAGAAFLQRNCFERDFRGVAVGSSLAAFFATVKASLDIYKENRPDFFRKPIGVFVNLGVSTIFSMLVSTGVIGYAFDIVEGFYLEVSKSTYWTTVGLTLGLNLLSEFMLVYLEYNKYPSRLERFLGIVAHLFQALLYSTEMTAFSLIFWLDAVTDLQDSNLIPYSALWSIIAACLLFGGTVMFNKLHCDKHFIELTSYYVPDYVKNLFNKHLNLIPYSSDEESDHSSREPSDSELQEYANEPQQPSIFASCKQTLVNAWQNFPTIEEVGLAPPINEEPLLSEDTVETRSWWSSLSCCFWSKTRVSDTEVKASHYLPPPINLENPAGLSA
jgi:hypothetical protein